MVNIGGVKTAWICLFCQGYMKRNKMPPTCHKNKLEIKDVEELLKLNKFDNMLIARIVLFMFIAQLPIGVGD